MFMQDENQGIWGILSFSIMFIMSWMILAYMEFTSGFIGSILSEVLSIGGGVKGVSLMAKIIVPIMFITSMAVFIYWVKGFFE
jgi:uncharacterized membrane protein YhdT